MRFFNRKTAEERRQNRKEFLAAMEEAAKLMIFMPNK